MNTKMKRSIHFRLLYSFLFRPERHDSGRFFNEIADAPH